MVMGEEYFSDSQWRTSRNQTDEPSAQKKETPSFKLWVVMALSLAVFSLTSCGGSKKVIEERQKPTVRYPSQGNDE